VNFYSDRRRRGRTGYLPRCCLVGFRQDRGYADVPSRKIFEDYDVKIASGAPRKQLNELTSLALVEQADNFVLFGPGCVGKSSRAISPDHKNVGQDIKRTSLPLLA
jgi:hypothetical protein